LAPSPMARADSRGNDAIAIVMAKQESSLGTDACND